ncbi:hypothetical protein [Microbacterium aurum]
MNIAPPDAAVVERRIDTIRADVKRKITRQSRATRIGISAALAATFALGGAGVATASFPVTVDMQGVVKTKYVDAFVQCSEDAGVETVILTGTASAEVLDGWTAIDTDEYTAIESRMDSRDQGRLGRALSACQQSIAAQVGEPIN